MNCDILLGIGGRESSRGLRFVCDRQWVFGGMEICIILWCREARIHLGLFRIISRTILYSLTICMLHYYPQRVSSINMPIFSKTNCILTASGIFALCKRLHSTLVESGLSPLLTSVLCRRLQRAKIPDAV